MLDSLFVPDNCVIRMTKSAEHVRKNRDKFLCLKSWHTYKGYAYSQLRKLKIKDPQGIGNKRKELIEKYGFDTKFAYHIVRLIDYAEQIMREGTIDMQRNKELWKYIREGGWTLEQIETHFYSKEKELEALYHTCKLPKHMREDDVKPLLLECLEEHYGSLDKYVRPVDKTSKLVAEISEVLDRYIR